MPHKNNRTRKINKYENLSTPQAEFDFHDKGILREEDIQKLTDDFLEECEKKNLTKVLFITGKGLHSKLGTPVIKPLLDRYLKSLPFVIRVQEGRIDRGGAGALEVDLEF